jgi:hypothetical protein
MYYCRPGGIVMRVAVCGSLVVGLAVLLATAPASAHHPIAAKFDPNKTTSLKGLVTSVDWANPHVHIFMNVQEGNSLTVWAVELESPIDLQKGGWNRETLKPGDSITAEGPIARDGSKQIWGRTVTVGTTGRRVFTPPTQTAASKQPAGPAPRWPDGKPRLGPAPGQSGYWGSPSATVLMQAGANVQMDADGLLRNIGDVDRVAPFQRWARDLYEYRQRNFLKDDPTYLHCMPPGGPRQFQSRYGVEFVEEKERQRIFVFMGSGNNNWRFIYLDGRPQQGSLRGDADNPLYFGRSVGQWEGDTLVVDTKGFNERFWFSNGGLPHTEQLHLIERFTRTDSNTLRYEVTIDDPGAYTRTWNSSWTLQWIAGEEMPRHYCQDNRP